MPKYNIIGYLKLAPGLVYQDVQSNVNADVSDWIFTIFAHNALLGIARKYTFVPMTFKHTNQVEVSFVYDIQIFVQLETFWCETWCM